MTTTPPDRDDIDYREDPLLPIDPQTEELEGTDPADDVTSLYPSDETDEG
jgi:hypothetical protein